LELAIETSWTVLKLKEEIEKKNEAKPKDMKIIYKGRILKDADVLTTYKIVEAATMHLVVSKPATTTPPPVAQS